MNILDILQISIHAPTKGATSLYKTEILLKLEFQSTHSRGVRREKVKVKCVDNDISIHALTGSATRAFHFSLFDNTISIHALTGSATYIQVYYFLKKHISIHALTGSAT